MFTGRGARDLKQWLEGQAEQARSNEDLARRFVEECRRLQIILPAISSIERLSADALVSTERRIEARIVSRLGCELQSQLDALLAEDVDGRLSRFITILRTPTDYWTSWKSCRPWRCRLIFSTAFHRIASPVCAVRESDTSQMV